MIQASTIQAPAPPAPPAPPVAPAIPGGTTISSKVLNNTPLSAQEVAALKARRSLLSDQLTSADGRRKELSRLVRSATGADKAGLEQRIGVLDARLARLESDIDETGKLLASPQAAFATTRGSPSFGFGPNQRNAVEDFIPIIAILSIFVLFPISLSIARNIWRRGSLPRTAGTDRESAQRLERMEQAMDAIAIEIERVSEGQRFVTRLLGEQRNGVAVGAGQAAEPVRVSVGEKARS
jgi:hypothetical protein